MTLVIFRPFETERPPLAIEKAAPTRSNNILKIDHPFVLFLL